MGDLAPSDLERTLTWMVLAAGIRWARTLHSRNHHALYAKAWRDIWGAGQGVGLMDDVPSVAEMVARLRNEYLAARARVMATDYPRG